MTKRNTENYPRPSKHLSVRVTCPSSIQWRLSYCLHTGRFAVDTFCRWSHAASVHSWFRSSVGVKVLYKIFCLSQVFIGILWQLRTWLMISAISSGKCANEIKTELKIQIKLFNRFKNSSSILIHVDLSYTRIVM